MLCVLIRIASSAGQRYRAKRGVGRVVRAVSLISDTLYHPYIHSYKSSSGYTIFSIPKKKITLYIIQNVEL